MENKMLYTCEACKGKFQVENIRYSKDGKTVVCVDCYNQVKTADKSKKKIEISPVSSKISDMIKVICVDCRYKFTVRNPADKVKINCPYCGKNRIMRDETTASKLIKEAH